MRDPECIVSGPFGTGKTVGILQKFHLALQKYDHAKMLVIRKRHTDLTATTLATFQSRVLNEHDGVKYFGGSGKDPAAFRYDNGSELVVARHGPRHQGSGCRIRLDIPVGGHRVQ